jgi:ATP-dependent helicase HrpB
LLAPLVRESVSVRWNGLAPKGVRVKAAGRLVLAEQPWRGTGFPEAATASLLERLRREGIGFLPWDDRARGLLARIRFLTAHVGVAHAGVERRDSAHRDSARGEVGPTALDDTALVRLAPEWLVPRLDLSGGPVLDGAGLLRALSALIPGRRADFDRLAPAALVLTTGTRCPIDYSSGVPAVEARIQEVFGLAAGPVICGVPLVFRLLSPAMRPLQVTDDLAGFWRSSYAEVRKQMRGRYPRHDWPEDPSTARATRSPPRRRG